MGGLRGKSKRVTAGTQQDWRTVGLGLKKRHRRKGWRARDDNPRLLPGRVKVRREGVEQGCTGGVETQGFANKGLGPKSVPPEHCSESGWKGSIPSFVVPRRHPHSPAGSGTALSPPPPPPPPPWLWAVSPPLPKPPRPLPTRQYRGQATPSILLDLLIGRQDRFLQPITHQST